MLIILDRGTKISLNAVTLNPCSSFTVAEINTVPFSSQICESETSAPEENGPSHPLVVPSPHFHWT